MHPVYCKQDLPCAGKRKEEEVIHRMEEYLVLLVENAVKRAKKKGWKRVSRTYNVTSIQATVSAKEELKRRGYKVEYSKYYTGEEYIVRVTVFF